MLRHVLKVDSVQLSFGSRRILSDVSLLCTQGSIIGLLGRNGCGKSSLLKIIFGTPQASHRYVSIDDKYIYTGFLNNRIAYLSQQNYLPHGIKIRSFARMLIDKAFWSEFAAQEIYQMHKDKTASQLSGGELRMLETFMIIYNKADFILLDEPFTHISPLQTELLKPIIKQCAQRKGIIITDHQYYNVLDVADRLIIIEDGCTKPVSSVEELVTYKYLSGIE